VKGRISQTPNKAIKVQSTPAMGTIMNNDEATSYFCLYPDEKNSEIE